MSLFERLLDFPMLQTEEERDEWDSNARKIQKLVEGGMDTNAAVNKVTGSNF